MEKIGNFTDNNSMLLTDSHSRLTKYSSGVLRFFLLLLLAVASGCGVSPAQTDASASNGGNTNLKSTAEVAAILSAEDTSICSEQVEQDKDWFSAVAARYNVMGITTVSPFFAENGTQAIPELAFQSPSDAGNAGADFGKIKLFECSGIGLWGSHTQGRNVFISADLMRVYRVAASAWERAPGDKEYIRGAIRAAIELEGGTDPGEPRAGYASAELYAGMAAFTVFHETAHVINGDTWETAVNPDIFAPPAGVHRVREMESRADEDAAGWTERAKFDTDAIGLVFLVLDELTVFDPTHDRPQSRNGNGV